MVLFLLAAMAGNAFADEARSFRLSVSPEIDASGLAAYLLPRFALKTARRAELVTGEAEVTIDLEGGPEAVPVMAREGRVFLLSAATDNAAAQRFVDWITSEVGQTTIAAFEPEDGPAFSGAPQEEALVEITFEGDAARGLELSEAHCGRCHRVTAERKGMDLGSTPSFPALRALEDWAERFLAFYALNPHPAFLRVDEISPPFDPALPPPIVPVELVLDEVEAIQAYVASLAPADLGAPVAHQ